MKIVMLKISILIMKLGKFRIRCCLFGFNRWCRNFLFWFTLIWFGIRFMIITTCKQRLVLGSYAKIFVPPLLKAKQCVSSWVRSRTLLMNSSMLEVQCNMKSMLMWYLKVYHKIILWWFLWLRANLWPLRSKFDYHKIIRWSWGFVTTRLSIRFDTSYQPHESLVLYDPATLQPVQVNFVQSNTKFNNSWVNLNSKVTSQGAAAHQAPPSAMLANASSQGSANSTWIPDFGASFHVTGEPQNISR